MSGQVDATGCVVCLDTFDPAEPVALLEDGWAHVSCADLMTMEVPC